MYEEDLNNLYEAAYDTDWNACLEAVEKLLPLLPKDATVAILMTNVHRFGLQFTTTHEVETTDFVSAIHSEDETKVSSTHLKNIHSALEAYTAEPGVGNFRNAIKKLIDLHEKAEWDQDMITIIVEIFAGILMGLLLEKWGSNNPELWRKWYKRTSQSDMFVLAESFWPALSTKQMMKDLWEDLARNIEKYLDSETR